MDFETFFNKLMVFAQKAQVRYEQRLEINDYKTQYSDLSNAKLRDIYHSSSTDAERKAINEIMRERKEEYERNKE